MKQKIGIVGIGMVGTPLMRWFLQEKGYERGTNLFCFDKAKKEFSDNILKAEIIFICVPTPSNKDGSCDTSIVEQVAEKYALPGKIMIIKSTVPPGTTLRLSQKHKDAFWLFNPEFLTEAQAWIDFVRPDRQIVAPADEKARKYAKIVLDLLPLGLFQSPGVQNTYDFHELNSTEAEIVKYASNCFGAFKVTFFNMLFDECDVLGVDFESVRKAVVSDRRIGDSWSRTPNKGLRGFTGFCFPKDMRAGLAYKKQLHRLGTASVEIMERILNYNDMLLASQGKTVEEVSRHDAQLQEKS